MMGQRARALVLWLGCIVFAAIIVARAHYITDLSAFLPANPTPTQQLLVDQLRDGPASRLILIAIEAGDSDRRTHVSTAMANTLRQDPQFASVNNGETLAGQSDREFLFQHRYLLSQSVSAARFSAPGLHAAIGDAIDNLASPAGLLFKSLLPRDPTGELLNIIDQLGSTAGPTTRDGVWVSPDGSRALAVVQTAASGSDSDAQSRAIQAIETAFSAASERSKASDVQLKLSGPGVFGVEARAKIEQAAIRLSIASSILVVALLLFVYRSLPALGLGLLPVASGALIGIAAVALGFGAVHGITLGFGITLIGESVDYSIYFFIQSGHGHDSQSHNGQGHNGQGHNGQGRNGPGRSWREQWWPTVRLGMLTSVCGFASLLPSGFPGLKQLGLYSISGLITAALVTRYVLPALLPANFATRDVSPFGAAVANLLPAARRWGRFTIAAAGVALALISLGVLHHYRASLWNRELAALSPISLAAQDFDAKLRADLGAADVRDLVIVSGPDLESILRGAERVAEALHPLVDAQVIGGFESPTSYLPSMQAQEARRSSLPGAPELRANLKQATVDLPVHADRLQPFLEDVEATRHAALVTQRDLKGTSLSAGFDSLILHQRDRWNALLPLHGVAGGPDIDTAKVAAALASAQVTEARVLNLKEESDSLYASYLSEAFHFSLAGFLALTALLLIALRSILRVALVLAPLVLAVLTVAAGLAIAGVQLTILHLVGMLLIVAIGSNYALFFDRQSHAGAGSGQALTLASLIIANASTVIGFGLLSFSRVPVLVALGTTVAPGAFLALLFAAMGSRMDPEHA
jgi:predicted exporter